MIVFGAKEREKVEALRSELSPETAEHYDEATTYHDGKWLRLTVDSVRAVRDVAKLLSTKRRPKKPQ